MRCNDGGAVRARIFTAMLVWTLVAGSSQVWAQTEMAGHGAADWMAIFELPFLLITIIFGFRTATALKGGAFGRGMALIAWGAVIMGIGHVQMQVNQMFQLNLLAVIFGSGGAPVAFLLALIATWVLTGSGFYSIYKASAR